VSKDGDWSETYACNLFDWHLKTQEKLDWLTGSAQWIFKDFASPLRGDNDIPRINQKGVVERDLTKKESYFVFQSYWAEKPMATSTATAGRSAGASRARQRCHTCTPTAIAPSCFSTASRSAPCSATARTSPRPDCAGRSHSPAATNHLRVVATKGEHHVTDEIELTYQTEPWGKPAELRLHEKERKGTSSPSQRSSTTPREFRVSTPATSSASRSPAMGSSSTILGPLEAHASCSSTTAAQKSQ
jgi:beta-galactosidase